MNETNAIPTLIYEIRGSKVMLDSDLAWLYGVETKVLNQTVKRNMDRFPLDFMFQLTESEWERLRSQIVISNNRMESENQRFQNGTFNKNIESTGLRCQSGTSNNDIEPTNQRSQIVTFKHHLRKYLPYAFTENGVAMLSSVLKSQRAIEMNIVIMRVFTNIRQYMLQQASKIDEIKELKQMLLLHIENTDTRFSDHDEKISHIIQILNNLIEHPKSKKIIGFNTDGKY